MPPKSGKKAVVAASVQAASGSEAIPAVALPAPSSSSSSASSQIPQENVNVSNAQGSEHGNYEMVEEEERIVDDDDESDDDDDDDDKMEEEKHSAGDNGNLHLTTATMMHEYCSCICFVLLITVIIFESVFFVVGVTCRSAISFSFCTFHACTSFSCICMCIYHYRFDGSYYELGKQW